VDNDNNKPVFQFIFELFVNMDKKEKNEELLDASYNEDNDEVELWFPSFEKRLFYDPSFALLLGTPIGFGPRSNDGNLAN